MRARLRSVAIALALLAPRPGSAAPVEQGPPNTQFQPAFPGQTRAPEVHTRTKLRVTTLASGFDRPWAIAFLPDRRMLVTEKPTGRLYVVTPDGKRSPPVEGLPRGDGRGQGGLLDVALGPDYATSGLVYWTYYEPRQGGNGLAVARARLVDGPRPRVEGLQVSYGPIAALWDVRFDVRQGEIVALVGANGAGKTTTLKAISNLLNAERGEASPPCPRRAGSWPRWKRVCRGVPA